MSEVAEKAAEVTADIVEETVDGVVETLQVFRTNPVLLATAWLGGLGIGLAGGYFLANKKLKSFYEDLAAQEISEAKEFYKGLNKVGEDGEVLSPMEMLEKLHPGQNAEAVAALREYQGRGPNGPFEDEEELIAAAKEEQGEPYDDEMDEEQLRRLEARLLAETETLISESETGIRVEEKVETRNVFNDPNFDLEEEKKHRTKTRPYVISHDEYFEAEDEYEQISLTYYEEDDTLVNEKDNPIQDVDKTIGDESLARFGHGSKDKNIVYVRNDRLQSDFEVVRSTGSYVVEVLGLPPEEPNSLKHSDQRDRRREFRRGMG